MGDIHAVAISMMLGAALTFQKDHGFQVLLNTSCSLTTAGQDVLVDTSHT